MRPKIVILTLSVALVALVVGALLKNGRGPGAGAATRQAVVPQMETNRTAMGTNSPPPMMAGTPVGSAETREAVIDQEVQEIQDLVDQADGSNNPQIITTLVAKLEQPEKEVREAALSGLRQLDDTNAIPPLQKAVDGLQDPREKVAVLDLIDYIRTPSITENLPEDAATNSQYAQHAPRSRNQGAQPEAPGVSPQ